jgi:imidazolonepropionase-like amidohydrolase
VGPQADFKLPAETPVLTAAIVTPGLIDAHTVVGLSGKYNVPGDQDQDERLNEAHAESLQGQQQQQ